MKARQGGVNITEGRVKISDGSREYEVEGNEQFVTAVLNDLGLVEGKTSTGSVEKVSEENSLDEIDWPSTSDVREFIEEKEKFRHSMPEISEHFFGFVIPYSGNKRAYDRLYSRVKRAQKKLEDKHNGEFDTRKRTEKVENGSKPYKEYYFVEDNEGEAKVTRLRS